MSTYEFTVTCESSGTIVVTHNGNPRIPKVQPNDILILQDRAKPGENRILQCFEDTGQCSSCGPCDGSRGSIHGKCIRPLGSRFCLFVRRPGLFFKDITKAMEEL